MTAMFSGIEREGRSLYVPSRTRAGLAHKVTLTVDNDIVCNCEAAVFGRECWAIRLVREELDQMTTEERMLPAIQVFKPESLLPAPSTYTAIDRAAELAMNGAIALPPEIRGNKAKIAALMLRGWELGLRPMTSLEQLFIINGRVQPSAQAMAGMVRARTDAQISVVESTDRLCTLRIIWPSRHINETWTCDWDEVVRAKLDKKEVWAAYPKDKLVWHTMKRLCRIYAPDIILGIDGPDFGEDEAAAVRDDTEWTEEDLYNPIDGEVVQLEAGLGDDEEHEAPEVGAGLRRGATRPVAEVSGEDKGRGVASVAEPEALAVPPPAHEEPETQSEAVPVAEGDPSAGVPAPPASPDVEEVRAEIMRLMRQTQQEWDRQDYARLYKDLKDAFTPSDKAFAISMLDLETAQRCLADLKRKRGDLD